MQEEEIRPKKLFNEYLRLSAKDAKRFFKDAKKEEIFCPACGTDNPISFEKNGFPYKECASCGTLYQSPRYTLSEYENFYRDSESARYWAKTFFPAVQEIRREKIFKPRVGEIRRICDKNNVVPKTVCDIGAGTGIFLEEWRKAHAETKCIAIEPSRDMADACRTLGFEVIERPLEHIRGNENTIDLIVSFELLEHVQNPKNFIREANNLLKPGGIAIFTTLGVDGFDIQLLWDKSKSVSPPHHINFFSKKGFRLLFETVGFSDIEIQTPGKLDVDIIRNAWKEDPVILDGHQFVRKILSDDRAAEEFQRFLQENGLSSHTLITARKS